MESMKNRGEDSIELNFSFSMLLGRSLFLVISITVVFQVSISFASINEVIGATKTRNTMMK